MKKWYVVHTQTGSEDKVKIGLEGRISSLGLSESVGRLLIPTEQVSEIKRGKKKVSERKFFPGYLLVEMDLDEQTYLLIKGTPGVTGFIGVGKKPTPLPQVEVDAILKRNEDSKVKPSPKIIFSVGDQVRVTDGPFVNFNGTIDEVYPDKGKIKVSVSIFGRATPVELEFWQVEKV
ncbi:MAG: transcription termination/antitermination protein NusG [Candidatus Omnitrophota bacterium]